MNEKLRIKFTFKSGRTMETYNDCYNKGQFREWCNTISDFSGFLIYNSCSINLREVETIQEIK